MFLKIYFFHWPASNFFDTFFISACWRIYLRMISVGVEGEAVFLTHFSIYRSFLFIKQIKYTARDITNVKRVSLSTTITCLQQFLGCDPLESRNFMKNHSPINTCLIICMSSVKTFLLIIYFLFFFSLHLIALKISIEIIFVWFIGISHRWSSSFCLFLLYF